MPIDIRKMDLDTLQSTFEEMGVAKYRAKQVHEWLWKKAARSFDEMTNLSKDFREELKSKFALESVSEMPPQISKDGTVKLGMRLHDDRIVEGVMIPEVDRATACVSSQVGCSLSCSFCATGFLKRDRNLEVAEIFDQIVLLNKYAKESNDGRGLTNIVYMGMGEPLLNYDNVIQSIRMVCSPDGLNMAQKRITLSTSGIVRGIMRLAEEGMKFNLALSLHAANDEKRSQIMDINKSNPIDELVTALNFFYKKTGNKITFEYILFDGFNDSIADANELIQLSKRVPAFINIIEYNNVEEVPYKRSKKETRDKFLEHLRKNGISAAVRRSRGKDIDAACGQLANKNQD